MVDLAAISGQKAHEAKKKEAEVANGLDKNAFMKLFLEQLKNQDPTSPMETDKIITQTAQLTQVEMQEESKQTMREVAEAIKSLKSSNESLKEFQGDLKKAFEEVSKSAQASVEGTHALTNISSLGAIKLIGKIAETDVDGLNFDGERPLDFALYFDDKIDATEGDPSVQIFNKDKQLVRTISLKSEDGKQGYVALSWDGSDDNGNKLASGSYFIKAEYNLDKNTRQYEQSRIGRGLVESVIMQDGKPMLKMGEMLVGLDSAKEFYDKGEKSKESVRS